MKLVHTSAEVTLRANPGNDISSCLKEAAMYCLTEGVDVKLRHNNYIYDYKYDDLIGANNITLIKDES